MTCKKTILCVVCVAVLWMLNPSLERHRPVAKSHIRAHLRTNYSLLFDWIVDDYTEQLGNQLQRESYIIFSLTRLRAPNLRPLMLGPEMGLSDTDKVTSIGFLGMVF